MILQHIEHRHSREDEHDRQIDILLNNVTGLLLSQSTQRSNYFS